MEERFTLIIPTYNESSIIENTLNEVARAFEYSMRIPWRIIVADNASSDGTADIVDAINDPRIRAIRLEEKGRGRAIREGFRAAGGGIVAFTDADLSVSPAEVIAALDLILQGECEVVIGSRFSHSGSNLHRTTLRNMSSKMYLLLARAIVGLRASDSQCPLKMMNERMTPVMLATTDPTWFSELEFVALIERLNITYKEFPVQWDEKRYPARKTKLKILNDGMKAIVAFFKIRRGLSNQISVLLKKLSEK